MRRITIGAVAAVAVVGVGGAAVAGGFQFRTTATGDQEVSTPSNFVLTGAEAKINIKVGQDKVGQDIATYNLRFTEPIKKVKQVHLHKAPAGSNGPIAVWLFPLEGTTALPDPDAIDGEGRFVRSMFGPADLCFGPAAPYCGNWDGFVNDLNAGNIYLNVHTAVNKGGEVRGQVVANHDHDHDHDS